VRLRYARFYCPRQPGLMLEQLFRSPKSLNRCSSARLRHSGPQRHEVILVISVVRACPLPVRILISGLVTMGVEIIIEPSPICFLRIIIIVLLDRSLPPTMLPQRF
jgi:hypothetical protein